MAGFHGHEAEGSASAGDTLAATNHIPLSAQCGPRLVLGHDVYIVHSAQNWVVHRTGFLGSCKTCPKWKVTVYWIVSLDVAARYFLRARSASVPYSVAMGATYCAAYGVAC